MTSQDRHRRNGQRPLRSVPPYVNPRHPSLRQPDDRGGGLDAERLAGCLLLFVAMALTTTCMIVGGIVIVRWLT